MKRARENEKEERERETEKREREREGEEREREGERERERDVVSRRTKAMDSKPHPLPLKLLLCPYLPVRPWYCSQDHGRFRRYFRGSKRQET